MGLMDFFIPAATGIAGQLGLTIFVAIERPDKAAKVREEISRVVGSGRLPTLSDRVKWVNSKWRLHGELKTHK